MSSPCGTAVLQDLRWDFLFSHQMICKQRIVLNYVFFRYESNLEPVTVIRNNSIPRCKGLYNLDNEGNEKQKKTYNLYFTIAWHEFIRGYGANNLVVGYWILNQWHNKINLVCCCSTNKFGCNRFTRYLWGDKWHKSFKNIYAEQTKG